MTSHDNKNHNSGFFAGFILGIAAALLLNTKKGKKILKLLVDQGIEKIGNWEEVVNEVLQEKDYFDENSIEGDDYVISSENSSKKEQELGLNESKPDLTEPIEEVNSKVEATVNKVKTATRRFFRGIKKKS